MTYAAIDIESIEAPGYYRAALVPLSESDNAIHRIGRYICREEKVIAVNVFTTRRRAAEVVDAWNETYRQNGTNIVKDIPLF